MEFFYTIAFYQLFKNHCVFINHVLFFSGKIFFTTLLFSILKIKLSVAEIAERICLKVTIYEFLNLFSNLETEDL